jgi:hypothetical protein
MSLQLRIAQATAHDLVPFVELLEEVGDWLRERGLLPLPPGIYRESADYFAASIEKGEAYIAWLDQTAAGVFRLLSEDREVWPHERDDALYVHSLAVRRCWSGNRFGLRLLEWSEAASVAAGKAFLRLDCFADNAVLRTYYETLGFTSRGEVDAVYHFGVLRLRRYEKRIEPT